MARRGLLAMLVHQAQVAARENQRAQLAAHRAHVAANRRAEQAQRAAERARAQLAKASAAERKRLEREAREAHVAAKEAEVEERNLKLEGMYADIDSLLSSTLKVDDHVDLKTLRVVVEHPPFDRRELELPIPPPEPIPDPPEPVLVPPDPPTGFAAFFGGKRKHAAALSRAQEAHERALAGWRIKVEEVSALRRAAIEKHARAESARVASLAAARTLYAEQCAAREAEAAERNRQLDELIANLGYGTREAVEEYISIVLSESVYPEHFAVSHEFEFEPSSAELKLRAVVPSPDKLPEIKAFKYSKATDEITATPLSQKACRDRYSGAIHQVALRTLHEVFESDRRGLIQTISLEVGTKAKDPATGRWAYLPFVSVAAERESFLALRLSDVVPSATLEHLGAAVSKNPYALVAVDTSGVRGRE